MLSKREDLKEALTIGVAQNRPQVDSTERMVREIQVPEGYELAFYTLRRLHDGQFEYFMVPVGSNHERVLAIPITPRDNGPNHSCENLPQASSSDRESREPSQLTVLRRAHARSDGYSVVCGVYSPEISAPVKSDNRGQGDFCCPRCGSNFTRPYSVKDHFFYCIQKHGNPQALRFTDHPSMAQTEAAIQRRHRASQDQEARFQEMNDALYVDRAHENQW